MEGIAVVASLAAFAAVWWWMNRLGKNRGWNGLGRHALGALAGIVAFSIAAVLLMPVPVGSEQQTAEQEVSPTAPIPRASERAASAPDAVQVKAGTAPAGAPTLGITVDDYVTRLRSGLAAGGVSEAVAVSSPVEGSAANTVTLTAASSAIVLQLPKSSDEIGGIIAIIQGSGSTESGYTAMKIGAASMGAAAPPGLGSEVVAAALSLMADGDGSKVTVGSMRMSYSFSPLTGGMLTADPEAPL